MGRAVGKSGECATVGCAVGRARARGRGFILGRAVVVKTDRLQVKSEGARAL